MSGCDLTDSAEQDLLSIWTYTFEHWGIGQADKYLDQIDSCCEQIGTGHLHFKTFKDLPDGVRVGRCHNHYLFWLNLARPIVIAVLHEQMDMVRQFAVRV